MHRGIGYIVSRAVIPMAEISLAFIYHGWAWVGYVNTHKTYHASYHVGIVYNVAITGGIVTKQCVISTVSILKINYNKHNVVPI